MAIAVLGSSSASATGATPSITLTAASFTPAPANGDLVVLFASDSGGDGGGTYSFAGPSPSSGWTALVQFSDGDASGDQTYVGAYAVGAGGFPSTTLTGALGLNVSAVVLSGAAVASVVDGSVDVSHNPTAESSITTGTVTTASAGSTLLAFFNANFINGRSWSVTPPSGMTLAARSTAAGALAPAGAIYYEARGTAGATGTRTATASASGGTMTPVMLAIKQLVTSTATFVPGQPARRRSAPTRGKGRARSVTPTTVVTAPTIVIRRARAARPAFGARRGKARIVQTVPAQQNPPMQNRKMPVSPKKPTRRGRGRTFTAVPAQIILTAPTFIPTTITRVRKALRRPTPRTPVPVPVQATVAPTFIPTVIARVRRAFLRRSSPTVARIPAQELRPTTVPVKRRSTARRQAPRVSFGPPMQDMPLTAKAARRPQPRKATGHAYLAPLAQVTVIAPARAAQPARTTIRKYAVMRNGSTATPWYVVIVKVIVRPGPDVTTRPTSVTFRPSSIQIEWENSLIIRPDIGTTTGG